jgi:toxin ParE1/3/4
VKVEWSHYAESDRNRIYDYIDAESPGGAILVDNRISNSIAALAEFPEIGRPGRVQGTRELVIQRTPYIAAYTIAGDIVLILRILHGAQIWPIDLQNQ